MNSTLLTPRQKEVFNFLVAERAKTGILPSLREIAKNFGFKSPNTVAAHLKALEAKGFIRRISRKARGLIIETQGLQTSLPVAGAIPAGVPVRTSEENEGSFCIQHNGFVVQPGSFVVRVKGESMRGAGILDGDLVIVEKRVPVTDDIVVALVDGESTLKRLIRGGNALVLKAENPDFADIQPKEELEVQGVVTAVIRIMKPNRK